MNTWVLYKQDSSAEAYLICFTIKFKKSPRASVCCKALKRVKNCDKLAGTISSTWLNFFLFSFFEQLIFAFLGLSYGETCKNWSEGDKECEHGCCGDYGRHYCCFHWKVYAIAGGVIGGLVILGGIGFLIFFIFYYKDEQKKRKIQPNGGQVLQSQ